MKAFFSFLFTVVTVIVLAQPAYKLDFTISGATDTVAYLGYYMGDNNYVRDTARVNAKGEFSFEGSKALPEGLYFLIMNKTNLFEFVVGKDQLFSIRTKGPDYGKNAVVTGDDDNKIFFANLKTRVEHFKYADAFVKIVKDSLVTEKERDKARRELNKINEMLAAEQNAVIEKYPDYVTARIMKAHKPIVVRDPPKGADGIIDSTFQLRWYREHYFDNIDLSDEAILRLPKSFYKQRIEDYLDRLFVQQADSITKAVDFVVSKAKKNEETYKYAVTVCALKYQLPEIMGLDEVFVNVHDKYFASGEMNYWANANLLKNFKEQADRIRRSMIGRTGDNLIMLDSDMKPRSMYTIKNKYTILYIFDPDCGFCKQQTPKLVNFYKNTKFDVEVFAVDADSSLNEMKKYIKEMEMPWITVNAHYTYVGDYRNHYDAITTPTLYVLNDKKKIIGKKVPIEKLDEFLAHYERIEKLNKEKKF